MAANSDRANRSGEIARQLFDAWKEQGKVTTDDPSYLKGLIDYVYTLLKAWGDPLVAVVDGHFHVGSNPWMDCSYCYTHFDTGEFDACPYCLFTIDVNDRIRMGIDDVMRQTKDLRKH